MNQSSDEEKVSRFLEDLLSNDPFRRRQAVELIGEQRLADRRLIEVLRALSSSDSNSVVRSAARSTLNQLGIERIADDGNNEPIVNAPPEPVTDLPSFFRRYQQQLWGFFSWFVIASLISPFSFGLITTPATVICLLAFGFSKQRKGIAGGMLVAVSLNFLVALVRGLEMNAWCFIPFYYNYF